MLDDMRQYLTALDIPLEQKRYSINFCKKMQYLDELHSIAANDTQEYVCTGYGNFNSKICFVFKDKTEYDIIYSLIQDMLDKFSINTWDIYITFVNKTSTGYLKKYSYLINEIHAINPQLLYVFDKDNSIYKDIINYFLTHKISLPEKHFFIDIQKIASSESETRKELWDMFKYLINYKEIGQEE